MAHPMLFHSGLLITFVVIFSIGSSILLESYKKAHCDENGNGMYFLYFPLFLFNNVFVTLAVFCFWLVTEQNRNRAPEQPQRRVPLQRHNYIRLFSENVVAPSDGAGRAKKVFPSVMHSSVYDNVYPWDIVKTAERQ